MKRQAGVGLTLLALTLSSFAPARASSLVSSDLAVDAVVLVPGSLNVVIPGGHTGDGRETPYFSQAILDGIQSSAPQAKLHVVDGLRPLGALEENAALVEENIAGWLAVEAKNGRAYRRVVVIGHSAGGLTALSAISHHPEWPVSRLIAVATPFEGAELADRVFESPTLGGILEKFCETSRWGVFDLRSLPELRTDRIRAFYDRLQQAPVAPVFVVGGSQPRAPLAVLSVQEKYLAPIFHLTSGWIGKETDGLVSVESAYAVHGDLTLGSGAKVALKRLTQLHANLDHAEQVIDYRILRAFGELGASAAEEEQQRFYSELIPQTR